MTRLSQTERTALCDTALQLGQDQPTLSGEWKVKDLVVHLLVREGSPAAVGILLAPLARMTDLVSRRVGRREFPVLVERLRSGPPRLSPFAVPKVDALVNTLELFIHHEDMRRAQPTWAPRTLGDEAERTLWPLARTMGRALTRSAPVGVSVEDTSTGATAVLRKGTPSVTVRGLPSELALYLYGRGAQARVELLGDDDAVARLEATPLGL